jgi:hypothetical protein
VFTCVVSYVDLDGLRVSVEVEAESVNEAALKAIAVFRRRACEPGAGMKLEVEMRTSICY